LLTDTMFHTWHRVRDGTMTRAAFQEFIERLQPYVVGELQRGAACPAKAVAGRCREILELSPGQEVWAMEAYAEGSCRGSELRSAALTPWPLSRLSIRRIGLEVYENVHFVGVERQHPSGGGTPPRGAAT
jgi:hypothetical protein